MRGKCFAQGHNKMTWPGPEPRPLNPDPLTGVQHTEHLAPVIPQAFMPGYLSFLEEITFLKVFTVDFV